VASAVEDFIPINPFIFHTTNHQVHVVIPALKMENGGMERLNDLYKALSPNGKSRT
jgi:hypothetical protein